MTRDESALVIIGRVITREGGIADVSDGKGTTYFGQTQGWLNAFGFKAPANEVEAGQNYRTWLVRTGLIGLCDYADSFADAVIDFAVNSGHRPAIQALQGAFKIHVDGVWGPETQARVDACDRLQMAKRVIAERMRYVGRIITRDPARSKFAAGWANRIAAHVEALS